jgi:RNase P subunit RPR2
MQPDALIAVLLLLAVVCGIAGTMLGGTRTCGAGPGFFLGFLLGVIGVAIVACFPVLDRAKCPHCAERVKPEARVCKHCGRDLTPHARQRQATPIVERVEVLCSCGTLIGVPPWSPTAVKCPSCGSIRRVPNSAQSAQAADAVDWSQIPDSRFRRRG